MTKNSDRKFEGYPLLLEHSFGGIALRPAFVTYGCGRVKVEIELPGEKKKSRDEEKKSRVNVMASPVLIHMFIRVCICLNLLVFPFLFVNSPLGVTAVDSYVQYVEITAQRRVCRPLLMLGI